MKPGDKVKYAGGACALNDCLADMFSNIADGTINGVTYDVITAAFADDDTVWTIVREEGPGEFVLGVQHGEQMIEVPFLIEASELELIPQS